MSTTDASGTIPQEARTMGMLCHLLALGDVVFDQFLLDPREFSPPRQCVQTGKESENRDQWDPRAWNLAIGDHHDRCLEDHHQQHHELEQSAA